MLTRALHLNIILWLAAATVAAQLPANNKQNRLLIRKVSFRLVATDIKYEGVETESNDVCFHDDPLSYGGRSYYWSDAMSDGLFVEGGESASKIYQPYDLAIKAGWYAKLDDETNNNIWGLFEAGGKIWMGSYGLGVLEFDPVSSLWSRYDWQYQAEPGATTYLAFVNGKYLFFQSRGAWFVYSRQRHACAQLATPLDSRIDNSQKGNGTVFYIQFRNSDAEHSYYAELESEFGRLASGR
jgi:hypothetical protein